LNTFLLVGSLMNLGKRSSSSLTFFSVSSSKAVEGS